jgi:hypothetical protein
VGDLPQWMTDQLLATLPVCPVELAEVSQADLAEYLRVTAPDQAI